MPIQYKKGDIFRAKTQTIVNTVNCKGVMGKGLALEFRKRYPKMYEEYRRECEEGRLTIGKLHLYKAAIPWILNFPTKNHWRYKSKIEYIKAGLKTFVEKYREWGIKSIAFPQLGCQQGGLEWNDVKPILEKYLGKLPGLIVHVYSYIPEEKKAKQKEKRKTRKMKLKNTRSEERQQTLTQYS